MLRHYIIIRTILHIWFVWRGVEPQMGPVRSFEWKIDTFKLFKSVNLLLLCCIFSRCVVANVYTYRSEVITLLYIWRLSARPTLLTSSRNATVASETLLYEKWSSTSLFHITFSVTRRLESEGGALWRNTLALGICTGAVIFTGATQLSEWGENIFFYRERRLNKPLTVEAVAQLIWSPW